MSMLPIVVSFCRLGDAKAEDGFAPHLLSETSK